MLDVFFNFAGIFITLTSYVSLLRSLDCDMIRVLLCKEEGYLEIIDLDLCFFEDRVNFVEVTGLE